ncbi:MAG: flagellar export protein FliJ [Pseudomonadales bacterium]|nr:flagellar export protein FliJ [Pseudomonadales bacterium]
MQLKSLQQVLLQAEELEAAEVRKLAGMQAMLEQERQQRINLAKHQQAYHQQAPAVGQQTTVGYLDEYSAFLQKLREALQQQDARIQYFVDQVEIQRQRWHVAHVRVESLQMLITRYEKEQIRKELKREQNLLDEFNQRRDRQDRHG